MRVALPHHLRLDLRAMTDQEFWDVLSGGMGKDLSPLQPEELVLYRGTIEKATTELWVVHQQIDNDRYTLRHRTNEWERLNASRDEIERVEVQS